MNTLVTVSCSVKSDNQTSPNSGRVSLQNKFRQPVRTASCGALVRHENTFRAISRKKKKKSFEVSSNPEVSEDEYLKEDTLSVQYQMCKPSHSKSSICTYPPSYAVPELKVCSSFLKPNPKRNTVVYMNPQSPYTSPLSPVKVFASTSLLTTSSITVLSSSPTTNRYSFCGSSPNYAACEKDLKYIDDPTTANNLQAGQRDRTFSISPSYQSDLSDCSFFPPTASSYKYYSPQSPSMAEEDPYSSSSQLCPCAMATTDSCSACARGLTFPLSPIQKGSQWEQVQHRKKLKIWNLKQFQYPPCFHIYFTLGKLLYS